MFWQDAKGQVIHEWHKRFGQREFEVLIVQFCDFDFAPQVFDILRIQRARALHHLDGEDDIVTCDRRSVVPDSVRPNGKIIDRAIWSNAPCLRQICLWQAMFIKANETAENQTVYIAIS